MKHQQKHCCAFKPKALSACRAPSDSMLHSERAVKASGRCQTANLAQQRPLGGARAM